MELSLSFSSPSSSSDKSGVLLLGAGSLNPAGWKRGEEKTFSQWLVLRAWWEGLLELSYCSCSLEKKRKKKKKKPSHLWCWRNSSYNSTFRAWPPNFQTTQDCFLLYKLVANISGLCRVLFGPSSTPDFYSLGDRSDR